MLQFPCRELRPKEEDTAARDPTNPRRRSRKSGFPDWVDPMLATLTDDPFSDPEWVFERKLDGVRLLAFRRGSEVR